jgi:hypothetical protein
VAKPRYRHQHQQERARLKPAVDAGDAYCVQPICLKPTRWIPPGTRWDVAHDDTGTVTLGPAHEKCNRSDGAVRGNKLRSARRRGSTFVKRPRKPANRWVL